MAVYQGLFPATITSNVSEILISGAVFSGGLRRRPSRLHACSQHLHRPERGTLAYEAALSNGAPLPSWLHFDATTETFTGVMPDGTQAVAIDVTATNKSSLSASESFVLSIAQAASQFGQAIAGTASGTGSLTFTPTPQDQSTHLTTPVQDRGKYWSRRLCISDSHHLDFAAFAACMTTSPAWDCSRSSR